MRPIDPDQFARIMSLPEGERVDLLEFLGATPVANAQIERLIVEVSRQHKKLGQSLNERDPAAHV